jgi:hypothetical protein
MKNQFLKSKKREKYWDNFIKFIQILTLIFVLLKFYDIKLF